MAEQHFRFTEEQNADVVQREIEPGQYSRLRLGVEVHQHVAAGQQVDAADRGVLDEVVPPEIALRRRSFGEDETRAFALEIALQELTGNGPDFFFAVGRLPRDGRSR
ncbi:hypothetical protein GCM10020369_75910 [Cryptosporangium minutisporangium]|uniref:Uncharacterized protein n=1 Tax=Cryptosporangium minutisporangium TaxID=113569 RepID=A0ABP6TAX8_9ACTN